MPVAVGGASFRWWWSYLPLQCCDARHWPLQLHPTQFKHNHLFHRLHRSLLVKYHQVQFNTELYNLHRDMPQTYIYIFLCSLVVLLGYYNVGIYSYVTITKYQTALRSFWFLFSLLSFIYMEQESIAHCYFLNSKGFLHFFFNTVY